MTNLQKIFERIDGYRDEIIQVQTDLTSKVALGPGNGGSGEHEKTDFIRELLEAAGPDVVEEFRAPDERALDGYRPNLIAKWGNNLPGPTVWVLSHSDVVPPGDLSLWESDPYQVKVEGDRVIGRGVEDNQHGFISSYLGLKAILASGQELTRPVALAVVADEETGSDYGLRYLLKQHGELFEKMDLIVVPDGGDEEGMMIEVAEKSMLWVRFTVQGLQCHASTPDKGKNSLVGAAVLITALGRLKEQFCLSDALFDPPMSTFEPTKMEPNVPNVNTIPGRNVFHMDCRILPNYDLNDVIAVIKEISAGVAGKLGLEILAEPLHVQSATEPTPIDAPVVTSLGRAIKGVIGKDPKPIGIGGGTVAAFFRKAGLPAVVWGTGFESPHQPNEYCLISNIITDAKIFASLYLGE